MVANYSLNEILPLNNYTNLDFNLWIDLYPFDIVKMLDSSDKIAHLYNFEMNFLQIFLQIGGVSNLKGHICSSPKRITYRFLISPEELSSEFQFYIDRDASRCGWVILPRYSKIDSIGFSGKTASFKLSNGNVTHIRRCDTVSFKNLISFLFLGGYGGGLGFEKTTKNKQMLQKPPVFVPMRLYIGNNVFNVSIKSININDTIESPYLVEYTLEFNVFYYSNPNLII